MRKPTNSVKVTEISVSKVEVRSPDKKTCSELAVYAVAVAEVNEVLTVTFWKWTRGRSSRMYVFVPPSHGFLTKQERKVLRTQIRRLIVDVSPDQEQDVFEVASKDELIQIGVRVYATAARKARQLGLQPKHSNPFKATSDNREDASPVVPLADQVAFPDALVRCLGYGIDLFGTFSRLIVPCECGEVPAVVEVTNGKRVFEVRCECGRSGPSAALPWRAALAWNATQASTRSDDVANWYGLKFLFFDQGSGGRDWADRVQVWSEMSDFLGAYLKQMVQSWGRSQHLGPAQIRHWERIACLYVWVSRVCLRAAHPLSTAPKPDLENWFVPSNVQDEADRVGDFV